MNTPTRGDRHAGTAGTGRRSRPCRCARPGFTLIELLVVISIIALLIGILLPALGSARDAARALQCLANMRSLGQAAAGYVTDHGGLHPMPDTGLKPVGNGNFQPATATFWNRLGLGDEEEQTANWFVSLDYYLSQGKNRSNRQGVAGIRNFAEFKQDPVWFSFDANFDGAGNSSQTVQELNRTIKMNRAFRRGGSGGEDGDFPISWTSPRKPGTFRLLDQFVRDVVVAKPSQTVLFGDGLAMDLTGLAAGTATRFSIRSDERVGLRHKNDSANIGFVDGSARVVNQPTKLKTPLPDPNAENAAAQEPPTKQWFAEYSGAGGSATGDPTRQFVRNPDQELVWDMIRDARK